MLEDYLDLERSRDIIDQGRLVPNGRFSLKNGAVTAARWRVGVGKHVVLADRSQANANAAAEVMANAGYQVSVATVDVSSRDAVLALVGKAAGQLIRQPRFLLSRSAQRAFSPLAYADGDRRRPLCANMHFLPVHHPRLLARFDAAQPSIPSRP